MDGDSRESIWDSIKKINLPAINSDSNMLYYW